MENKSAVCSEKNTFIFLHNSL